ILAAFFDEDGPACGYSWTFLGSTNVPTEWNMTASSVFGVLALGLANNLSVDYTNNIFADNFCASSGLMPTLGIIAANGKVVVSWPTNAPACHLESVGTLTPPSCWQIGT